MKIHQQVIIKPENISLAAATPTTTLEQLFIEGYYNDSGSGALVDQGVHGDLGDRVVDRVNRDVD